jgi:hypothetical protein
MPSAEALPSDLLEKAHNADSHRLPRKLTEQLRAIGRSQHIAECRKFSTVRTMETDGSGGKGLEARIRRIVPSGRKRWNLQRGGYHCLQRGIRLKPRHAAGPQETPSLVPIR